MTMRRTAGSFRGRCGVGVAALALLSSVAVAAAAPSSFPEPPFRDRLLPNRAVRVSEHVWSIVGFPNIGIVVGSNATLVVDTGLGARNGATVAAVAKRLAPKNRLILTTTHSHPEHVGGVRGFPPGTYLIRNVAQQQELDAQGENMIAIFASQNPQWHALLAGEQLRAPDETFEREKRLDLGGGVTVRLMWLGPTHTKGDEVTFVEPDRTLITGDVVQNRTGPYIYGEAGTPESWIAVLDELATLKARHVLPDHSPAGDGTLVTCQRALLIEIRDRALALKQQGKTAEQAGAELTAEFQRKYPTYRIDDVTGFIASEFR